MNRLTIQGPSLSSSQVQHQQAAKDSSFETELYSFLAELSKATDMSTLHKNLTRLKLAMMEEANKTDNSVKEDGAGDDSDASSSMASPERAENLSADSPERSNMDLTTSSISSASPGDTSSSTNLSTDTSLSSSPLATSGAVGRQGSSKPELRSLRFSVQSGARFDLKEKEVREVFSQYGELLRVGLYHKARMGFDGYLEFRTAVVSSVLENSLVKVGDCELHCSLPWETLTSQPVPHQILLESRYLPRVWERDMILRSFFSKYGVVTGVSMIGFTPGKLTRYVISFKDPKAARDLIGSYVKILSSMVWVREVTRQTIAGTPQVSRDSGASNLPWRK